MPPTIQENSELEKPRLWTFNFLLICLSTLTLSLVFHSFNTTLPVYIEKFGGTAKIAGLALSSLTAAAIISRPITGYYLDKYGRKLIFLGGLILFMIPTAIYLRMIPVVMLIAIRFIQGLGWGIGHTSTSTVALDIIPKERLGEGLGVYSLANSVSMSCAPAIALWLINNHSFEVLFLICLFITTITLILALSIRYPKTEKQPGDFKFVIFEKTALRPSIMMLIVSFMNSALISFLPLYAQAQGLKTAGYFFTATAITILISRFLSGILIDRMGARGYDLNIIAGSLFIIIALLIIARTGILGHLIAGGLIFGLGFGLLQFTLLFLAVNKVPPEKKGSANATYYTAVDLGIAAGSFFWGFVAAAFGYKSMYYLAIIPIAIAFCFYFKWKGQMIHIETTTITREG
jgi:MFS family permease